MSSTIRDVARRAGVSIATVSRVLNKSASVSDVKRQRVEAAALELGYTPNPAARSLLGQSTGGIGVLLPYVAGDFFSEFLQGIDRATQEHRRFLMISSSHRNPNEFRAALSGLDKRVDGLLVMSTELAYDDLRDELLENVPVVFVNTRVDSPECDVINFDNEAGGRAAATHLIEVGHRRIAVVKGPEEAHDSQARFQGYRSALKAHGIPYDEALVFPGDYTHQAGFDAVSRLLALPERPTALFAFNDYSALGALRAANEAGLAVPDDLALVGFDDIPLARFTSPPLTSVRVPLRELGERAIHRLIARINGEDGPPEQVMLPVEVVPRASTGAP